MFVCLSLYSDYCLYVLCSLYFSISMSGYAVLFQVSNWAIVLCIQHVNLCWVELLQQLCVCLLFIRSLTSMNIHWTFITPVTLCFCHISFVLFSHFLDEDITVRKKTLIWSVCPLELEHLALHKWMNDVYVFEDLQGYTTYYYFPHCNLIVYICTVNCVIVFVSNLERLWIWFK